MAYFILAAVLFLKAVLQVGLLLKDHENKKPLFWYIEPFVFPSVLLVGAMLECFHVIEAAAYAAILGLVFELITFIIFKSKYKPKRSA